MKGNDVIIVYKGKKHFKALEYEKCTGRTNFQYFIGYRPKSNRYKNSKQKVTDLFYEFVLVI